MKGGKSIKKMVRRVLLFFVASLSLTVVYYVLFSLVFSTEAEKRLERENDMFQRELPQLQQKEALLADVIGGLGGRDDRIYEEIFQASAPSLSPLTSVRDFSGVDTIPDQELVVYAQRKLDDVIAKAESVEEDFMRIAELLRDSSFVMPPMSNPLDEFTFAQTGASVGDKINPFYKVPIRHNGLDMVSHSGEPVHVTADGVVADIIKSRKGLGNVVVVSHKGGYVTRYAHLADIEVKKGRSLKKGDRIGYVGVSGNSFAPHLHYEVLRDTLVMDPVNYMFASLDPEEYVNVMILAVTTGQSLD
jgi:murein DD-endopeptidase MepM/ murein hydrolase activator NlpD